MQADAERSWCDRCGRPLDAGSHESCVRRGALEPPRWCPACGRRLVVQVLPNGYTARCSRHGAIPAPDR